ncbi:MAG: hypothetical protein A2583_09810 [Bdellovibrionales bacterium RIFOXYD1_FULL_53_11]|nr:MAG: hypothetical protein A2583_09810 [Bdellovibrionales bacterium RIFOXYD1_FULL_53_11]
MKKGIIPFILMLLFTMDSHASDEPWNPAQSKTKFLSNSFEIALAGEWYSGWLKPMKYDRSYSQTCAGLSGRLSLSPPQLPIFSLWIRGHGTVSQLSGGYDPKQDIDESVKKYGASVEFHFSVVNIPYFYLTPFFGGCIYVMEVRSKKLGFERAMNPHIGFRAGSNFSLRWFMFETAIRIAPLQPENLFTSFDVDQLLLENETTLSFIVSRYFSLFALWRAEKFRYLPGLLKTGFQSTFYHYGAGIKLTVN